MSSKTSKRRKMFGCVRFFNMSISYLRRVYSGGVIYAFSIILTARISPVTLWVHRITFPYPPISLLVLLFFFNGVFLCHHNHLFTYPIRVSYQSGISRWTRCSCVVGWSRPCWTSYHWPSSVSSSSSSIRTSTKGLVRTYISREIDRALIKVKVNFLKLHND